MIYGNNDYHNNLRLYKYMTCDYKEYPNNPRLQVQDINI